VLYPLGESCEHAVAARGSDRLMKRDVGFVNALLAG
jgi:hypothetical protein